MLIKHTHIGRPNSSRSIAELCVTPSLSINIFLKVVTFTSISSGEYLNKTQKQYNLRFIYNASNIEMLSREYHD